MDSFIFALNAVLPIILTVAAGYVLKRLGFMNADFCKRSNRLVFHLFLPCLLFLNVYKMEGFGGMGGFIVYGICALLAVFGVGCIVGGFVTRDPSRRGVIVQGTFRSNYALIGIPLAGLLFGDEGAAAATVMSAVSVPMLNVLAVIALSVFKGGKGKSVGRILADIAKNPLLRAILAGVVCVLARGVLIKNGVSLRLSDIKPVFVFLEYLASVATPLALVTLGAQFDFSAVKELRREIIAGTLMRTAVVPLLGIGCAYLLFRDSFTGAHFATFIALFATPVAVSSVPMTQEMGGDTTLAGQLVVWTTAFSVLSVFLCALLLRIAGIF